MRNHILMAEINLLVFLKLMSNISYFFFPSSKIKLYRFSFKTYEFLKEYINATLDQFMDTMDPEVLRGHPAVKNTFKRKTGKDVRVFF